MSSVDAEKASLLRSPDTHDYDDHDALFDEPDPKPSRAKSWLTIALLATSLILLRVVPFHYTEWVTTFNGTYKPSCTQEAPLVPTTEILEGLETIYATESFQNRSAAWLSGAVQIPTESYDDLRPVGSDPRWDVFALLHAYLRVSFPKTFSTTRVTAVNTYNLVLHWEGSDPSLKPILLTGHQDVVPVDPSTISKWEHPPYSGHYDGTYIFGRGTSDDKSGVIGILSSFETLIEKGFKPRRTIVFATGIDEEASGLEGAGVLAGYLEDTYGRDRFAMLVDEGGSIVDEHGIFVALPDVGEKGYLDVRIEISTAGGHSSIPPAHTSIGLLAIAINLLEANPHKAHLSRASPFYAGIQCMGENNGDNLPPGYAKLIKKSLRSDSALKTLEYALLHGATGKENTALLSTTQAVDLIEGGVKVNALPERASAVVNHRISSDSSVAELTSHLTKLFTPLAEKHNLSLISFGSEITPSLSSTTSGTLRLSDAYNNQLDPAPITPTDTIAYSILSGSIRAVHQRSVIANPKNQDMIVAPMLAGGNTDTRFYWNLTRNIFRYNHFNALNLPFKGGVHTVNEAIPAKTLVDGIRFFTLLILNCDESESL